MSERISDLIQEHAMTLRDGAMVCKAGDWPDNDEPMPDSDMDDLNPFSTERMEYALDRVLGHREHLAAVVDRAVDERVARAYARARADEEALRGWDDEGGAGWR